MITLKEAIKTCQICDNSVFYISKKSNDYQFCEEAPTTLKEVREKYDMKNTKVIAIIPHFDWGEYNGLKFILSD